MVRLFALALLLLSAALAAQAQSLAFTRDEIIKVQWHGPWPPAPRANSRSPSRAAAAALGERLFFDPRLSGTGSVLCASCHVPYLAFQDARPLAFGLEEGSRNTPSLLNAGFFRRYGWDGARANLAAQSVRPLLEAREMRSSVPHVASILRKFYASDYRQAFARSPNDASDEQLFADAGRALAAFQETLLTGRTPFDEFRDALAGADSGGASAISLAAQRGLKRFVAQCSTCHAGALFSDGAIVRGFRVPSLRNVARTAPYLHDGSLASLEEAARHNDPALSREQAEELAAFLNTLSETGSPQ